MTNFRFFQQPVRYLSLIIIILCVLSCGGETRKHDDSAVYKEGEILVKFRQTASEMNKDAAHRMLGAQVIKKVKIEGVERIGLPVHLSVEEAVRLCRQNPDVEYAEPNYLVRAAVIPDDPRFNEQWYLLNTGQTVNGTAGTVDADIDAPESWEITQGIPSVVVAVIDSGVDKNHPDIKDNLLTGYDFVDEDNDPEDLNGHGTHVAGIIGAAANNAQGVAGIAWKPRMDHIGNLNGLTNFVGLKMANIMPTYMRKAIVLLEQVVRCVDKFVDFPWRVGSYND